MSLPKESINLSRNLTALESALLKTDKEIINNYAEAATVTNAVAESTRREIMHDIIQHTRKMVKQINLDKFAEMPPSDQSRILKTMIETVHILSEQFKTNHDKAVGSLSDDDLEKIAKDGDTRRKRAQEKRVNKESMQTH